jgi:hypothetical protein
MATRRSRRLAKEVKCRDVLRQLWSRKFYWDRAAGRSPLPDDAKDLLDCIDQICDRGGACEPAGGLRPELVELLSPLLQGRPRALGRWDRRPPTAGELPAEIKSEADIVERWIAAGADAHRLMKLLGAAVQWERKRQAMKHNVDDGRRLPRLNPIAHDVGWHLWLTTGTYDDVRVARVFTVISERRKGVSIESLRSQRSRLSRASGFISTESVEGATRVPVQLEPLDGKAWAVVSRRLVEGRTKGVGFGPNDFYKERRGRRSHRDK